MKQPHCNPFRPHQTYAPLQPTLCKQCLWLKLIFYEDRVVRIFRYSCTQPLTCACLPATGRARFVSYRAMVIQHLSLSTEPPRRFTDLGKSETGEYRAQNVYSLLRATALYHAKIFKKRMLTPILSYPILCPTNYDVSRSFTASKRRYDVPIDMGASIVSSFSDQRNFYDCTTEKNKFRTI